VGAKLKAGLPPPGRVLERRRLCAGRALPSFSSAHPPHAHLEPCYSALCPVHHAQLICHPTPRRPAFHSTSTVHLQLSSITPNRYFLHPHLSISSPYIPRCSVCSRVPLHPTLHTRTLSPAPAICTFVRASTLILSLPTSSRSTPSSCQQLSSSLVTDTLLLAIGTCLP
jgi:hypothetical protein